MLQICLTYLQRANSILVRAHTPQRNPRTVHPNAHSFGFGAQSSQHWLKQNGLVQLARENLAQASVQNSLGNSAISDVSTTDVVSFQTGESSILSNGESPGSGIPDANTLSSGARGHESFLLSIEVNELSRTNRITHRMAQTELSALEAMMHQ